ncbi:MAG: protein phosphatase [Cyanobium sp. CACIAM 14]|nr:MAG: protein phosphatase [Cyanobium sp. CACIAM 14]
MAQQPLPPPSALQATLVDFAIAELVRQHRESFLPLWTVESWAKLLIWLALNCGCSGHSEGLEAFAGALGPGLAGRMRRLFFQRELTDLGLQVLADPAEPQVLLLPLESGSASGVVSDAAMDPETVAAALARVGLTVLVTPDRGRWRALEALTAVPWRSGDD